MARRSAPSPTKVLAVILGFLVFSGLLAAVYYVRSPNLEPPVSGQQGTPTATSIDNLALQALDPIGPEDTTGEDATPSPGDPTAVPAGGPAQNRPGPGQTQVPDGWDVIDVYVDGWTLASIAEPIQADDPTHNTAATIAFQPLSPTQLAGVLKEKPDVIAKYAARLISNDKNLTCTPDGCTANGQPLDMTTLAEPQRAAGIGPLYRTYGIDTGLYLARIAVPKTTEELTLSTSTSSLIVPGPASQVEPTAAPEPSESNVGVSQEDPNAMTYGTVALAGGYGVLFELKPAWIEDGANFNWNTWPFTRDAETLLGDSAGPLLLEGPGSTQDTLLVAKADPTMLTYITSPTTGCGLIGVCTPQPADISVNAIQNSTTTACYQEPSDSPQGRVALLRQDLTVTVTPPGPIYLPGVGNGDGTLSPIDVTSIETTSGPETFSQTIVYVLDDNGILTYAGGREIDDASSFSFDKVRDGSFVSCSGA